MRVLQLCHSTSFYAPNRGLKLHITSVVMETADVWESRRKCERQTERKMHRVYVSINPRWLLRSWNECQIVSDLNKHRDFVFNPGKVWDMHSSAKHTQSHLWDQCVSSAVRIITHTHTNTLCMSKLTHNNDNYHSFRTHTCRTKTLMYMLKSERVKLCIATQSAIKLFAVRCNQTRNKFILRKRANNNKWLCERAQLSRSFMHALQTLSAKLWNMERNDQCATTFQRNMQSARILTDYKPRCS